MKVKFLMSIAGHEDLQNKKHDFSYAPGQVATVDDHHGKSWIASGICEAVSENDAQDSEDKQYNKQYSKQK